jgi:hypothetical protein
VIEQTVVHSAERQPIRQLVGSAVGVPANVCGIDKIKPSTNRSENPQMQHSAR